MQFGNICAFCDLLQLSFWNVKFQVQKELERAQAEEKKLREALDKTKKEEERKREKVTYFQHITCPSKHFTEIYYAVTPPLQLSISY